MYSRCLFCHEELGSNGIIEKFPVGRRLAFDAAKGRLWVVCRKCERWNLTPLEERWEAIEDCEWRFRDTKTRVSTAEIGLARLKEGLELVRIGEPLRPEFAAWRYGDQFGRRRTRAIITGVTVLGALGLAIPFGATVGLGALGGFQCAQLAGQFGPYLWRLRVMTRFAAPDGKDFLVTARDLRRAALVTDRSTQTWSLRIPHAGAVKRGERWNPRVVRATKVSEFEGEDAIRMASRILPLVNRTGGRTKVVTEAVTLIEEHQDPSKLFYRAARLADRGEYHALDNWGALARLEPHVRLALEMSSHEDAERRALEGELYLLEAAWKEAKEIATISDNMFVPAEVSDSLARMKGQSA